MQTAAEYRALCYQTYTWAEQRLRQLLAERKPNPKPPAVVLDLDETVFDNSAFQTEQLRGGLAYDQTRWDTFEENDASAIRLVPGAKDFLLACQQLSVNLVYISNRNERFRGPAISAIQRLGLPFPTEATLAKQCLLLATKETGSNKDSRRAETESRFEVLLFLGDNLRDFEDAPFRSSEDNTKPATRTEDPAKLAAAIAGRFQAVDQRRAMFGTRYIVFPNPAYGEWQKPLGLGLKDLDRLQGK
jgi:acid phosphatase